jgi:hypothetical protein
MPSVLERSKVNRELQRLGFGSLKDPSLPLQFAVCVRDHAHFRGILMHIPEGMDRKKWYEALAPNLRFKAKPLADYEAESKRLAEQNQLPTYDPATLEAKEFKPQEFSTITKCRVCEIAGSKYCLEHGPKESTSAAPEKKPISKLTAVAEEAINRDLREGQARVKNTLICHKCTRQQEFRMKHRSSLFKIVAEAGWFIDNLKAYCPECKPPIN